MTLNFFSQYRSSEFSYSNNDQGDKSPIIDNIKLVYIVSQKIIENIVLSNQLEQLRGGVIFMIDIKETLILMQY